MKKYVLVINVTTIVYIVAAIILIGIWTATDIETSLKICYSTLTFAIGLLFIFTIGPLFFESKFEKIEKDEEVSKLDNENGSPGCGGGGSGGGN